MEYYDQIIDQPDAVGRWAGQSFEQCTVKTLDLSGVTFADASFVNCRFEGCRLSDVVLKGTKLYDVTFVDCPLERVDFGVCNPFGFHVDFERCRLDNAVFLNRKLKKVRFTDCSLREVQFLQCELVGAAFRQCNLELARFEGNDLSQADFSSSYNLTLDPDTNKLKKARLSLHSLPGLLTKHGLIVTP